LALVRFAIRSNRNRSIKVPRRPDSTQTVSDLSTAITTKWCALAFVDGF